MDAPTDGTVEQTIWEDRKWVKRQLLGFNVKKDSNKSEKTSSTTPLKYTAIPTALSVLLLSIVIVYCYWPHKYNLFIGNMAAVALIHIKSNLIANTRSHISCDSLAPVD